MRTIDGAVLEVAVVVNGVTSPIYRRQSDGQAFVESPWGVPYQLRIRNLTNGRVEILTAVDGRNTLKDEAANLTTNRGMIIQPHATWNVTGWRLDDEHTAEFKFTDPEQAVATQATGSERNTGVIGVAVYQEYIVPPPTYEANRPRGEQESFSLGPTAKGASDTGTGMGRVKHDAVGRTTFNRRTSHPAEIFTIQYRSRGWLMLNGIIQPTSDPNPFPGGDTGYSKYR